MLLPQVEETQKLTAEFQHAQSLLQAQLGSLTSQLKEAQARLHKV